MELPPYTNLSVTIGLHEKPHITLSFHTPDVRARARIMTDGRPYLSLRSEEADVSVSASGGGLVTTAEVETAREIFTAAARYLADCERLHAEQAKPAA
ncbi:hypothetical protein GT755_10700 [Herbidospora sp. NEAU-GS84]|uniref:Uncharacterized protein n=1 Tax=Herbidospora solisilvae TaxID=2696284 RepID=A0A7C9MWB9_9ACTN|nr:hypothetical protein [Herbidospora solisilvae]NAS22151.1 hypothetical protein [Herbidospora solisilvae]